VLTLCSLKLWIDELLKILAQIGVELVSYEVGSRKSYLIIEQAAGFCSVSKQQKKSTLKRCFSVFVCG